MDKTMEVAITEIQAEVLILKIFVNNLTKDAVRMNKDVDMTIAVCIMVSRVME